MKGINLIKVLSLSIHPPYISWFYRNHSNFFLGIIFSIKRLFTERAQSRRGNCLVLPHASYGPASYASHTSLTLPEILKAGGWSNAQTFAKHYNKPIVSNFGTSVLEHFQNYTH